MTAIDRRIRRVVDRGACSGCGLCPQLDSNWEMRQTADGFSRPFYQGGGESRPHAARDFARACPGMVVTAVRPTDARRHPTMGSYFGVWEAWSADAEIRRTGSSGGVLTALHVWLLATGRAARIAGAAGDQDEPRRTVPVTIMTRDEALAAAGSRYAPVSALANPSALVGGSAVTAKPCEISALSRSGLSPDDTLMLSFFCAGTPSQNATDELIERLGIPRTTRLDEFWYRGRGWPGHFTARAGDLTVATSYEESWGQTLGPATQWRCKVCPDGVGESADIVAADFWTTDDAGYPSFEQGDGASALIARTRRGYEIITEAISAGVIHASPIEMEQLARVQPLQVTRRRQLLGRLTGSWLAGRRPPRYAGFGLLRPAVRHLTTTLRVARATYGRVRRTRGKAL
ncbi:MAG: Coenzyme F420 hydrogenase/dehydrogenase, beta subunit C-terminal domain [Mycetocola sp.]